MEKTLKEYLENNPEMMLEFLEKNFHLVLRVGGSWYYRAGLGKPYRKAKSLKDAIIKASLGALQQGFGDVGVQNGRTPSSDLGQTETQQT